MMSNRLTILTYSFDLREGAIGMLEHWDLWFPSAGAMGTWRTAGGGWHDHETGSGSGPDEQGDTGDVGWHLRWER